MLFDLCLYKIELFNVRRNMWNGASISKQILTISQCCEQQQGFLWRIVKSGL